MDTKVTWKMAWKILHSIEGSSNIYETLNVMKDDLVNGLLRYKFHAKNFDELAKTIRLKKENKLTNFVKELCFKLNLDLDNMWPIFCNYLMFECNIKVEKMADTLENSTEAKSQMVQIMWNYYGQERMYSLKTLEYILRKHNDKEISKFLQRVTYEAIQNSLIDQLEYLASEISIENIEKCVDFSCWVLRNCSEQLQVLALITTTIGFQGINVKNFLRLLKIFSDQFYMKKFNVPSAKQAVNVTVLKDICYLQYAVVYAGLKGFWHNHEKWYTSFDDFKLIMQENIDSLINLPVVVAWSLLQFTLPPQLFDPGNDKDNYGRLIDFAVGQGVFKDLVSITSHPILKGTFAEDVVKIGVAEFLEVLCGKIGDKKISFNEDTLHLAIELLCSEKIADTFFDDDRRGLKNIFEDFISLFPTDVASFSLLYGALADSENDSQMVMDEICKIKLFSEICKDEEYHRADGNIVLKSSYKPLGNEVEFPAGLKVSYIQAHSKMYRLIHGRYSYFNVLCHLMDTILHQFETNGCCDANILNMLMASYKLVTKLVNNCYPQLLKVPNINTILHNMMTFQHVLAHFDMHNVPLLRVCLDLAVAIFQHNPEEICKTLSCTLYFPELKKATFDHGFLHKDSLFTGFPCIHIYRDYQLILPLIKITSECVQAEKFHFEMQLRGCAIIIGEWYPKIMKTDFLKYNELLEIATELVNLVFIVLKKNYKGLSVVDTLIYDSFATLFLNNETYYGPLLNIIDLKRETFDNILLATPNSYTAPSTHYLELMTKSLWCVYLLLDYISCSNGIGKYSTFENRIYNSVMCEDRIITPSTLYHTFGFLRHNMNFEVPRIVYYIFTEFVKVSDKPLDVTLQLNQSLCEDMFLECLVNPTELDITKVAVINLIEACLHSQPKMIMLFFQTPGLDKKNISVNSFLISYVSTQLDDTTSVLLYSAIIHLLHTIVNQGRRHIIEDVVCLKEFCDVITWPLFKTTSVNIEIMLELFEILIYELFVHKTTENDFTACLSIMFDESGEFITKWMHYFMAIAKNDSGIIIHGSKTYVLNIVSVMIWKRFLLSVKHFHPEYFDRGNIKLDLANDSFSMVNYFTNRSDDILIRQWAEIYTMLDSMSPEIHVSEMDASTHLSSISSHLVYHYLTHQYSYKINILTIFLKVLKKHCKFLMGETSSFRILLKRLNWILRHETRTILQIKWNNKLPDESLYLWSLIVSIMNIIITQDTVVDYNYEFLQASSYLPILLNIFGFGLKMSFPIKLLHVAGYSLTLYAESKLSYHFLNADMKSFYINTLSHKECWPTNIKHPIRIIPQRLRDWWAVYVHIVRLNKMLLCQLGHIDYEISTLYINLHEAVMCDALHMVMLVADYYCTRLAANVIYFLNDIISYYRKRSLKLLPAFERFSVILAEVLSAAATIFVRPDVIAFFSETTGELPFERHAVIGEEYLIDIVSRYLHLMAWICLFFIKHNPKLSVLVPRCQQNYFHKFIVNDFRIPMLLENSKEITFATLLTALHYLCDDLLPAVARKKNEEGLPEPPKYYNTVIITTDRGRLIDLIQRGERMEFVPANRHPMWIYKINKNNTLFAFETISTFVAVHSYFVIRDNSIAFPDLCCIWQELVSQLQPFYVSVYKYFALQDYNQISLKDFLNRSQIPDLPVQENHGLIPLEKLTCNKSFKLNIDVRKLCVAKPTGMLTIITDVDDAYLVALAHFFRNHCKFRYFPISDKVLGLVQARSAYIPNSPNPVNYSSRPIIYSVLKNN